MSFHKTIVVEDAELLHEAALVAKAALDAIPEIEVRSGDDITFEHDQIQAAIKPADAVAHKILMDCLWTKDWRAAARAAAWLDGEYWNRYGAAA